MAPPAAGGRRRRPILRDRAFAAAFVVGGLALLTWPFVRVPPLSLVPAFLHLLGAWALVVLGLWRVSRALAPGAPGGGAEDDDA